MTTTCCDRVKVNLQKMAFWQRLRACFFIIKSGGFYICPALIERSGEA